MTKRSKRGAGWRLLTVIAAMALVGRELPADLEQANTVSAVIGGGVLLVCLCVALLLAVDFRGELRERRAERQQGGRKPVFGRPTAGVLEDKSAGETGWQLLILVAIMCVAIGDTLGHLRAGNGLPATIDGGIFLFCFCGAIPLFVKFVRGRRWLRR